MVLAPQFFEAPSKCLEHDCNGFTGVIDEDLVMARMRMTPSLPFLTWMSPPSKIEINGFARDIGEAVLIVSPKVHHGDVARSTMSRACVRVRVSSWRGYEGVVVPSAV